MEKEKTKRELRKFGIIVGTGFCILSLLLLWKEKSSYPYFLGIGLFLIISGIAFPNILSPIHKVWMAIAYGMGWVMTRVLLTIAFYLVFTPLGLVLKLFKKDLLDQKIDKNAETYWKKREDKEVDKEQYERLF